MHRALLAVIAVVSGACGDNRLLGAASDAHPPAGDSTDARALDGAPDGAVSIDAHPDALVSIDGPTPLCPVTPCATGAACALDTDCVSDACDSLTHLCVADPCIDHHRDRGEADVDCGDHVCAACPTGERCTAADQCARFACDGVASTCALDRCIDHQQDNDETDVDCGGILGLCNRCHPGKACLVNSDCQAGTICIPGTKVCGLATCTNHVKDGFETDVDCGGLKCGGCPLGDACAVNTDCASGACVAQTCVHDACTDGVKDGDETAVDCGGAACAARCLAGAACSGDTDCASGACDAWGHTCVSTTCIDHHVDHGEAGVDCGGATSTCDRCADGAACATNADCASGACDAVAKQCEPPTCGDHVLDGNESAIDCGGACAACAIGAACLVDQDCATRACDAVSNTCVASQCADHHQEVTESAVDCGGPCAGCPLGVACRDGSDCASNTCDDNHLCHVPWCIDGTFDYNETDTDCGGGICPGCGLGGHCLIDGDCASQACDPTILACVPDPCMDNRLDNTETDIDCGGTTCATRCAQFKKCITNSDCEAGHTCTTGTPHFCN